MTRSARLLVECLLAIYFLVVTCLQFVIYPGLGLGEQLISAASVVLYGVAAGLAFRLRPRDPRVRVFVCVIVLGAATFVVYAFPPRLDGTLLATLYVLVHPAVFFGFSATLLHLCALLPELSPAARRRPWLVPAGYATAALLVAIAFLVQLNARNVWWDVLPSQAADVSRLLRTLVVACYAAAALGGSALVAQAGFRAASLGAKRQAIALCTTLMPYGIHRVVGTLFPAIRQTRAFETLNTLVVFLVPLGLFIAVVGFGLFELGLPMRRGLRMTLTLGLVIGAAYALALTLGTLLPGLDPAWRFIAGSLLALAVLLPCIRYLSAAIDTLFYPERVAVKNLTRDILGRVAEYTDLRLLGSALALSVREAMALEVVALYVARADGEGFDVVGVAGTTAVPRVLERPAEQPPFVWVLPITFRGSVNAVLAVGRKQSAEALAAEERRELAAAALQIAAVIENARLFALATRDTLTGLYRRTVFEERLTHEVARHRRDPRPFAVVLLDIDDFKRLNDDFGHQTGDHVLQEVGTAVNACCREVDTAARYGGEELVVLLATADDTAAELVAEKLRAAIAALRLPAPDGRPLAVSVSVGVAGMRPGLSGAQLIERADTALYRAKREGKNRVMIAPDGPSALPAVG